MKKNSKNKGFKSNKNVGHPHQPASPLDRLPFDVKIKILFVLYSVDYLCETIVGSGLEEDKKLMDELIDDCCQAFVNTFGELTHRKLNQILEQQFFFEE